MTVLALLLLIGPNPVCAEPVEAPLFPASAYQKKNGPSTSSGRTERGSVIDAERAFAADAQRLGQWTAFRKWAAPDAVMFTPKPVRAQDFLRSLKNPRVSVRWYPVQSIVACDGATAVNFGFWTRPGDRHGYLVTVWRRQHDGRWRWLMDGGGDLDHGYPSRPIEVSRGACKGEPYPLKADPAEEGAQVGRGASADGTLVWQWTYAADGARMFETYLWDGRNMTLALERDLPPGNP